MQELDMLAIPDAHPFRANFICDSLDNLQSKPASILHASTVLVCAVIGLWLDELINDVAL